MKIISTNKHAFHDFQIVEKFESGLVLKGSEIKSIRAGGVSLRNSYVKVIGGEVFLLGTYIKPFQNSKIEAQRTRKLLLSRPQIKRLIGKTREKGLTLIPLKIYFKKNFAKIEIALAKGKRKYDRREEIKKRDTKREMRREIKYH